MAVHDKFVTIARKLIQKNGRSVTFVEIDRTSADPTKPWEGPTDPTAIPTRTLSTFVVAVEPDSLIRLGIRVVIDQLLQNSDKILIVQGPDTLDGYNECIDEGLVYKISKIETLRPGITTLLHFVGLVR